MIGILKKFLKGAAKPEVKDACVSFKEYFDGTVKQVAQANARALFAGADVDFKMSQPHAVKNRIQFEALVIMNSGSADDAKNPLIPEEAILKACDDLRRRHGLDVPVVLYQPGNFMKPNPGF